VSKIMWRTKLPQEELQFAFKECVLHTSVFWGNMTVFFPLFLVYEVDLS